MTRQGRRDGYVWRRFGYGSAVVAGEPAPPVDANGLVLLVAPDAVQSSGVTVPNRIGAGSWTGASATKTANYMNGRMPAVVGGGSIPLNLSTYNAVTIYVACYGGGTTEGYLFAHGTATTRLNAIYNRGTAALSLRDVRVSMVGAIGETFYTARSLSGGDQAAPAVYCFTFSTATVQQVGNPRIDNGIASFIDFGQVAQAGNFTNANLNICQDTAGGNVFNGGWAAVYVRSGEHTITESRAWSDYLHYFLGSYRVKQLEIQGHSIMIGASANTGGARVGMYTTALADVGRSMPFRMIGQFGTLPSGVFAEDYCLAASGWTYDDILVYIPSTLGPMNGTDTPQIGKYFPDIVYIQGATNYFTSTGDMAAVQAKLDAIADAMFAVNPSIVIGVGQESSRTDDATAGARVVTWNARIASIVAAMRARGINARECTAFQAAEPTVKSDGLHLVDGPTGYGKVVPYWYADILALVALHGVPV